MRRLLSRRAWTRHTGWMAVGAIIALPPSAYLVTGRISDNCQRVHVLYLAIDRVIADNDRRISHAVRTGVIGSRQAAEGHQFNARARKYLKAGDCH
jgi:hypothetical protein